MARSAAKKISLYSLSDGMPGLTPACGTTLAESAAVCLENRVHPLSVPLRLTGTEDGSFILQWTSVSEQQRRCHSDIQEATERGAYGVAILVVKELTGKIVMERSRKGPGFDYWLGDQDDDLLFSGKTRLEVSGLLSGSKSQIKARVRQKWDQMRPSNHIAPGYVAVVEFGGPVAHVEVK